MKPRQHGEPGTEQIASVEGRFKSCIRALDLRLRRYALFGCQLLCFLAWSDLLVPSAQHPTPVHNSKRPSANISQTDEHGRQHAGRCCSAVDSGWPSDTVERAGTQRDSSYTSPRAYRGRHVDRRSNADPKGSTSVC